MHLLALALVSVWAIAAGGDEPPLLDMVRVFLVLFFVPLGSGNLLLPILIALLGLGGVDWLLRLHLRLFLIVIVRVLLFRLFLSRLGLWKGVINYGFKNRVACKY